MQHTDTHAGNRWLPSRLVLPTSKSKRMSTMVNRNAFVSEPAEFVSVIAAKDLPENKPIRVNAQGTPGAARPPWQKKLCPRCRVFAFWRADGGRSFEERHRRMRLAPFSLFASRRECESRSSYSVANLRNED